jgi:DNA-binding transcriptional regulator YiaG
MIDKCLECLTPYVIWHSTIERPYDYTECGLSNVHLIGVDVYRCEECQLESASIPHINSLHGLIAKGLLSTFEPLTGAEFRYLRKESALGLPELSRRMGVDREVIKTFEVSETESKRGNVMCEFVNNEWALVENVVPV